ncbi:RDD family protein [Fontisphaera persica]|uniref:RDD family protein n=1 Tax=Fontisphaera persica TaxID=2974023 RepID=UPI0024BF1BAE|nr:RDD family protein [Fontisphaera persica]WCJ60846.1 RDD family protein [Fontisphaera persica]
MTWFYSQGGQQFGPVTDEEFQRLRREGVIGPATLVWREGLPEWVEYQSLAPAPTAPPPVDSLVSLPPVVSGQNVPADHRSCVLCGRYYPPEEVLPLNDLHLCAGCKPVYRQMVIEGLPLPASPTRLRFAPLGRRVVAFILDGIILYIMQLIMFIPASLGFGFLTNQMGPDNLGLFIAFQLFTNLVSMTLQMAYYVFFWHRYAATPGKMVCRLKIVRGDGSRMSLGRCFGRHFATWLSALTCCVGYLTPWFDEERRALHDFICDTRVIEAPPK